MAESSHVPAGSRSRIRLAAVGTALAVVAALTVSGPLSDGLDGLLAGDLVVGPQQVESAQHGGLDLFQAEVEPADQQGDNDTTGTAELVDGFGTGDGDASHAEITGTFAGHADPADVPAPAVAEDDGAVDLATDLGLNAGERTEVAGRIGDGPNGSGGSRTGDVDMVRVIVPAGLSLRAELRTPAGSPLTGVLTAYDGGGNVLAVGENGAGDLDARVDRRTTRTEPVIIAVGAAASPRPLDPFDSSTGLGVGGEGDYTLTVSLVDDDLDVWAVDLEAGDVLGATLAEGRGRTVQVIDAEGVLRLDTSTDTSRDYPAGSTLGGGGPHGGVVAGEAGRWYVAVSGGDGPYVLLAEAQRPALERAPRGVVQTFLLDLDGEVVDGRAFGGRADAELDGLAEHLADFGLDAADLPTVRAALLETFTTLLDETGASGWDVTTDLGGAPAGLTSTIVIGGTIPQLGASLIAEAPTLDLGNVDPVETGVVLLDTLAAPPTATGSLNAVTTDNRPALVGTALGILAARVAAQMVGARQTAPGPDGAHLLDPSAGILRMLGVDGSSAWETGRIAVSADTGRLDHRGGTVGQQDTAAVLRETLVAGADDVDDPPVVADDRYTLPLGTLEVPPPGVLGNDHDPELLPLAATLVDPPSHGTLDLSADGSFAYVPDDPTAPVDDTFTYDVADATGVVGPVTVDLDVCGGDRLRNGSFETGDLTGWCLEESPDLLMGTTVVGAGQRLTGPGDPEPTDGFHSAVHSFEALGDGSTSRLVQLLDVPTVQGATTLGLTLRTRWDLSGCEDCAPRQFRAVVEPLAGGTPLLDEVLVTAAPGSVQPFTRDVVDLPLDLSAVAGQRIRLSLVAELGDGQSGPAHLEVDDVRLPLDADPTPSPTPTPTSTTTPGPGPGPAPGPAPGPLPGPTPTPSSTPAPEVTPTPTDTPTEDPDEGIDLPDGVTRLEGAGRELTAVSVSRLGWPEDHSADSVVLARRDDFADGLAGAPLAAEVDGPMLLTPTAALHPDTSTEIQRVLAPGGTVHVLGGTAAISEAVVEELQQLGFTVQRSSGPSRFATAVAIADRIEQLRGSRGATTLQTVFLVRGDDFPDALAAGPAAIATRGVVLLTAGDTAHPDTETWLTDHPWTSRVAVGGQAAQAHPEAEPIVGAGRELTAVEVAERFFRRASVVGVARSDDFADALSGGALVGALDGPLLLTPADDLHPAAHEFLTTRDPRVTSALLFGGPAALSEDVAAAVRAALR